MKTSDGYIIIAPVNEKGFRNFLYAVGLAALLSDKRFNTFERRRDNWAALMMLAEQWSAIRATDQCLTIFREHNVPCSPYRTVNEALHDPQLQSRRALSKCSDAGGPFDALNLPFRMSAGDPSVGSRAPALGEHTQEILADIAGDGLDSRPQAYDNERIT